MDVKLPSSSNIEKTYSLKFIQPDAFLHIDLAHSLDLLPFVFNFDSVVNSKLIDKVSWVYIKLIIPVGHDQHIANMLSDLPIAQRHLFACYKHTYLGPAS